MESYLGEIRLFAGDFVPKGWLPCDGRLLKISDNSALYSLIEANYGGNGVTQFALPDMRGRVPLGAPSDANGRALIGETVPAFTGAVPPSPGPADAKLVPIQHIICVDGDFPKLQY